MNPYTQNKANIRNIMAAVIRITTGILGASTADAVAATMRTKPISNGKTDVLVLVQREMEISCRYGLRASPGSDAGSGMRQTVNPESRV